MVSVKKSPPNQTPLPQQRTIMKAHFLFPFATGLTLFTLNSCENPADKTTDATIGEAAQAATVEGGKIYHFRKNSKIEFVGSKVTGKHDGGFKDFEGQFVVKDGEPQGGNFTIKIDSTWSDNDDLTAKLKTSDFFDAPTYPTSEFIVTNFHKKGNTSYQVSGNLTLHGETKNITFPTTVETSDNTIKVSAEFDINRKDFGIVYPGRTGDLIRDEVIIKLSLEAKPSN